MRNRIFPGSSNALDIRSWTSGKNEEFSLFGSGKNDVEIIDHPEQVFPDREWFHWIFQNGCFIQKILVDYFSRSDPG